MADPLVEALLQRYSRPEGDVPSLASEPQNPLLVNALAQPSPTANAMAAQSPYENAMGQARGLQRGLLDFNPVEVALAMAMGPRVRTGSPDFAKWGARPGTPRPMESETQLPLLTTEGAERGKLNFRDTPEAIYIEGALGGGRENKGQVSRAIKALMEHGAMTGRPVIATRTEGARPFWDIMGFRKDGINSVFDADQLAKLRTGDINSTIWGHPRGYGDMFAETYGPGVERFAK